MFRAHLSRNVSAFALCCAFTAPPLIAAAQTPPASSTLSVTVPPIDATAAAPGFVLPGRALDTPAPTGSRLNLTPRETPASINTMTAAEMRQRGFDQVQDAIASFPGVIVGDDPIDPSAFSMRGFTTNQIQVLRDGVYLGPSGFINRPSNSFNVESVEVLKGPASLLYGLGAIGGVVNVRTKEPEFGPTKIDAMISGGSFGTYTWGLGLGTQINDKVAIRLDVSRTQSDGFVHNAPSNSFNFTGSVLIRPTDNLTIKIGLDVVTDQLSSYYGTPLIPASAARSPLSGVITSTTGLAIDNAMRFNNYNVAGAELSTTSVMPSVVVTWKPTDTITITDMAYYYHAERRWQNAETYTYIGAGSKAVTASGALIPAGSIARDRFYVYHHQTNFGNTLTSTFAQDVFGLNNKAVIGVDVNRTEFIRDRGFPSATYADYVDAWAPNQGSFGAFPGEFPVKRSPTYIDDFAVLFEDVLTVVPGLRFVTGARYELQNLDRENFNQDGSFSASSSFRAQYHPFNLRAGLIYDVTKDIALYGQYTTARDPIGSAIFLVNAGQNFTLSTSRQIEIGAKASFLDGKGAATLALFDIHRENILTQISPTAVGNIGSQYSRGVELSTEFLVTPHWKVSLNGAYTDAHYGTYSESATINDSGKLPPDVPAWTADFWTMYSGVANLPLDAGMRVRFVGTRAGNSSNTLFLNSYTLIDLVGIYHVTKNVDATFRVNNLLDKAYAQWAEPSYPSEVILGAPRSFTFGVSARF
jgi:iron complex outermembrane recepter protein